MSLPLAKSDEWLAARGVTSPRRQNRPVTASSAAPQNQSPDRAPSRVQERLENPQLRDRNLLKLLRKRRAQPSQLSLRLRSQRSRKLWWRSSILISALTIGLGGTVWSSLFVVGKITYKGVPYQVIQKFWQDEDAKAAYLAGDRQALHYRLASLGVERDIKNYYRDRFDNEYELDRYIHQIMYDRTGYVGEAYQVDKRGQLISKRAGESSRTF